MTIQYKKLTRLIGARKDIAHNQLAYADQRYKTELNLLHTAETKLRDLNSDEDKDIRNFFLQLDGKPLNDLNISKLRTIMFFFEHHKSITRQKIDTHRWQLKEALENLKQAQENYLWASRRFEKIERVGTKLREKEQILSEISKTGSFPGE